MRLSNDAFCRERFERNISFGIILTLILIVSLLLPCANAETKYIFIHWDNNTVKMDGKYTIEVKLGDKKNPPPQNQRINQVIYFQ